MSLKKVGLVGYTGVKKTINQCKKIKRSDFAKKYEHWTKVDWHKVRTPNSHKIIKKRYKDIKFLTIKHGGDNMMV